LDTKAITTQIETAIRELGLDEQSLRDALKQATACGGETNHPAMILAQANERLRAEIQRLTSENDKLVQRERAIAELISAPSPDQILHDLRNLLNELILLKALAKT
jgi:hypothetical protein